MWMIISCCDGMTLLCYKYLLDKHQKQLDDTDLVYCCQNPKAILFRLLRACQISHFGSRCGIRRIVFLCTYGWYSEWKALAPPPCCRVNSSQALDGKWRQFRTQVPRCNQIRVSRISSFEILSFEFEFEVT